MSRDGWTQARIAWLRERALEAGFDSGGVTSAEGASDAELADRVHFEDWIQAGSDGEMKYLRRRDEAGHFLRSAVNVAVPWAKSIVLCSINYHAQGPLSIDSAVPTAGWIGRYAWSGTRQDQHKRPKDPTNNKVADTATSALATTPDGSSSEVSCRAHQPTSDLRATDYHDILLRRLRRLEADLQTLFQCESRCYVDTGPIVERAVAARAGLGWIGKNTTVINQNIGSWTLLGCIVTSIPMDPSAAVFEASDRCGTCTRCIEACPTDALFAPRQMDASRCISYLTIEKKGEIDVELREGMGRQVFGCDICQDVCPWNRRAPIAADPEMIPRSELINPDLEWLAGLSSAEFRRSFNGSPLERTGRKRLHRNVAIAMGNSGEQGFRERLEVWKAGEDPVLAEAAQWALTKLEERR